MKPSHYSVSIWGDGELFAWAVCRVTPGDEEPIELVAGGALSEEIAEAAARRCIDADRRKRQLSRPKSLRTFTVSA